MENVPADGRPRCQLCDRTLKLYPSFIGMALLSVSGPENGSSRLLGKAHLKSGFEAMMAVTGYTPWD
jgi:hypothetical protein